MTDQKQTQEKISIKEFVHDFKNAVPDQALKDKYRLSAKGFVALVKKLLEKGILVQGDLTRRKEVAAQRDLAKEAQFLQGLYICPQCGHPHPVPFEECPACGAKVADFKPAQDVLDNLSLTTSGSHIYLEDESHIKEAGDTDTRQAVTTEEKQAAESASAKNQDTKPKDQDKKNKSKGSAVSSIRSFFSRKKKE
jgi:hypothetical protein